MTQFIPQWTCTRCNALNSVNARFCSNCGLPFQNSNTATSQSAFNPPLQEGGSVFSAPRQEAGMQPSTQYPDLPNVYPYPSLTADPYGSVQHQAPPPPPPPYVDNPYTSAEKPKQPSLLSRRGLV